MPVQSWAHAAYWRRKNNTPALVGPSIASYPAWQSAVFVGSIVGACQYWFERLVFACRWARVAWGWAHPSKGLTTDQRRAIVQAARVVDSPAWALAQQAVAATAKADKMNERQEWMKIGEALRGQQALGVAENMWRHMHAYWALYHEPLTNPDRNLLIELAYHEFAASGRGKPPRMA